MKEVKAWPKTPAKMVMMNSDEMEPKNTIILLWRMAIKAAIRKVLSPISETTIIEMATKKEVAAEDWSSVSPLPAVAFVLVITEVVEEAVVELNGVVPAAAAKRGIAASETNCEYLE